MFTLNGINFLPLNCKKYYIMYIHKDKGLTWVRYIAQKRLN